MIGIAVILIFAGIVLLVTGLRYVTDEERTSKGNAFYIFVVGIAFCLYGVTLFGFFAGEDESQPDFMDDIQERIAQELTLPRAEATRIPRPDVYYGGSSGCQHFINVMGDVAKGKLTKDEILTKTREFYEDTKTAEPRIAAASLAMLEVMRYAKTRDRDTVTYAEKAKNMVQACTDHGYL